MLNNSKYNLDIKEQTLHNYLSAWCQLIVSTPLHFACFGKYPKETAHTQAEQENIIKTVT